MWNLQVKYFAQRMLICYDSLRPRVGGRENFFHCETCGCCYATELRNNHRCIQAPAPHYRLAAAASWLGNRGWQHLTGPTRASSPSAALSPAGIPAPFRSRAGFNRKYSPLLLATRACPSAAGLHAPELPRLPGEPLQLHVGVPGVRRAPRPPHHPSPPSDRAFAWGVRDPGGRGQWPACRPPRTAASRRRRRGPSLNR